MTFDKILTQARNCLEFHNGNNPYKLGKTFCATLGVDFCVNSDNENVSIVFKGTDSEKEWIENFMFCKKVIPYNNPEDMQVKVHSGFVDVYNSPKVRDTILQFVGVNTKTVIVTGHSRGAALAALCSFDIKRTFPKTYVETYLFGCPRVGNSAFSKIYNESVPNTIRVVNGNDFVTKIPPAGFGYCHVGKVFKIGAESFPFVYSLEDHKLDKYYKNLLS